MIYLHRILPLFVLPVGITLLLVLAGLLLRRRVLIWSGAAILWLSSTPLVGGLAVRTAEMWKERGLAIDAPAADPGGHLKIPHPWPGQTPPPDEGGTRVRGCYAGAGRFATRAAASFKRQLLPSNFSRCP